jgi:hypothetical protein
MENWCYDRHKKPKYYENIWFCTIATLPTTNTSQKAPELNRTKLYCARFLSSFAYVNESSRKILAILTSGMADDEV